MAPDKLVFMDNMMVNVGIGIVLVFFCMSLVFLFQHMKETMQRKDYVLPAKASLEEASSRSSKAPLTFQLKVPGGVGADLRFGFIVVLIATLVVGVGGGGFTIGYFIRKGHLATTNELVVSAILSILFFAVLFYFAVKAMQHFLRIFALAKATYGKEVVFEETRVLFSIGLTYSNHQDKLAHRNESYIEIPYSQVEEIQVLTATVTNRRTLHARILFMVTGDNEPIAIQRHELGSHEEAIIAELRARIKKPVLLVDHLEREKEKFS